MNAHAAGDLAQIVEYMRAHWPSRVKPEWQVSLEEYPEIVRRVVAEWGEGASRGREFCRIAGQSGSGKTTQLLPAVEKYFENGKKRPILVAARKFVQYHPHVEEIRAEYGEENLRKMTDEFSTIMMFMTLVALTGEGYDLILDVTLLDPAVEKVLIRMLEGYEKWMTMVVVASEVTEKFLGERAWRHTKETEQEFVRATRLALQLYEERAPEMRMVMWNVWEEAPVYDGEIRGALEVFDRYMRVVDIPEHDEGKLREAKIGYLAG